MRFLLIFVSVFLFASVGKIVEIKGNVKILRAQKTLKAKINMPVELKDTILTYDNSKAKVIFTDKTVITIGQNSAFKIQDYFMGKKPKAKFNFLKGTFISVTGKIGKIAPKRFKLQTKNASIGIRGTIVFGDLSAKKEVIGCSQGLISVAKNNQEFLVKSGEMVNVFPNKITPPVKVPKTYLKRIVKKLSLNKKEIKSFFGNVYTPKEGEKVNKTKKNTKKTENKSMKKTNENTQNNSKEVKNNNAKKNQNVENQLTWQNYINDNAIGNKNVQNNKVVTSTNSNKENTKNVENPLINTNNDKIILQNNEVKINKDVTNSENKKQKNDQSNTKTHIDFPPNPPRFPVINNQ